LGEWAGAFGIFMIIAGLRFKTPMPIQPIKAVGGAGCRAAYGTFLTGSRSNRHFANLLAFGFVVSAITKPNFGGVPMCTGSCGLGAYPFSIIPTPVLGVVLFFVGLGLTQAARDAGIGFWQGLPYSNF